MTQRARRRRRRLRESGRKKLLLGLGLPLVDGRARRRGWACVGDQRLRLGALAREPAADHEGVGVEGVRRRRLPDRGDPLRQDPAAGRQRERSRRTSRTRRSRSRTGGSTTTAASIPRRSSAPAGRTWSPGARPGRAARRSPSSSSATSTSRTRRTRSSARSSRRAWPMRRRTSTPRTGS